jgi:hypothetical protein
MECAFPDSHRNLMPGQYFVDGAGRQVVLIRWDMGMRYVDIEFAGNRLVRLDGPEVLLTTGMQGAAPDGNLLVVAATRETGPVTFSVQHAGQQLDAQPVDYAMHPPVVEIIDALNSGGRVGASQAGLSMDAKGRLMKDGLVVDDTVLTYAAGARKINYQAITTGRIWVGVVAGLSLPLLILVAIVMSLGSVFLLASPDLSLGDKARVLFGVVYTVAVLVLNVLSAVFAFKRVPSFSAGKLLFFVSFIWWAILYFGIKALGNAQDQAESIAYNDARERHLGVTAGSTL